MSVAEAVRRPRPRVVSTRLLRSELRLIFTRRRNIAGMGVLAAVPVLIAVAIRLSSPGRDGGGPDFFSSVTENGLFVAMAALTLELPLFLPLAVAAISGDSVAGEANLGTLRYLLVVPVARARLLGVKYAAIAVFALAAAMVVTTVGVVLGLVLFGGGDMTLLSGSQVGFLSGVARVLAATCYIAACLSALGAVGLFVSSLTEQPIGATVAILVFSTASFILDSIPQVSWLHPFLLTHHWLAFGDLFRAPVAWDGLTSGLYVAAAYAAVFWLAAWARFLTKDVTS
ncbi:MAG: ABC transporter permease subunit [Nocardioidaceae bacterium]|nr:ABC transporter permease subunit [Nocardioidaceae bacterium]